MRQSIEIRAFKNELRNYDFYKMRIDKLNDMIEYCYDMLGGSPRTIDPSKDIVHSPPNKDFEYKIRDEIERHESNLKKTQDRIDDIEAVLSLLDDETREACINIYIKGINTDLEANRLYISHNALLNRINKRLEKAIKKRD